MCYNPQWVFFFFLFCLSFSLWVSYNWLLLLVRLLSLPLLLLLLLVGDSTTSYIFASGHNAYSTAIIFFLTKHTTYFQSVKNGLAIERHFNIKRKEMRPVFRRFLCFHYILNVRFFFLSFRFVWV